MSGLPVQAETLVPTPAPSPGARRLGHVDNLRAVAALLVVWTHLAEDFSPRSRVDGPISGFLHAVPPTLNLGHLGVVLFFAISGFVIYGSLARRSSENAGRVFALSRFFRLYPAYWVSLLAGLIVLWWLPGTPTPWPMLAANVAMVPGPLGQERVLGLYWTLEVELLFYVCCWSLYRSGLMARPWTLPVLIFAGLFAWTKMHQVMLFTEHRYHHVIPDGIVTIPRHLAIMFWGALCREAHEQTGGFRRAWWRSGRTALALAFVVLIIRWCGGNAWNVFWHGVTTGHFHKPQSGVAYLVAPLLFAFWVAGPRINLRPLRWLGEISYSLYLFHPVVSALLVRWPDNYPSVQQWPLWVFLGLGVAATVAVSAVVYYVVERPAIRLGAWLAERGAKPALHEPTETPFKTVAP